jgi:hypothetical protein
MDEVKSKQAPENQSAKAPESQAGGTEKQSLFAFLVDATEQANAEHCKSNNQRAKGRLNNLWWFFIRQAKLHDRMRLFDENKAARQLAGFFDICNEIACGKRREDERTTKLATQFLVRLAQQGEVASAGDMETKVLKVWKTIESTPGESKVCAAVRTMFSRRNIEAIELVPVLVSNHGKYNGKDNFSSKPVEYDRTGKDYPRQMDALRARQNNMRAHYVKRIADGAGAQQWWDDNCERSREQKEGVGWQNQPANLAVDESNPRRCFAFMLWELWRQIKINSESAYWSQPVVMMLGGGDVAKAFSPYVPIAERTVGDLRNWMVDEGVLRLVKQGGRKGKQLIANEYSFDPIGWVLWWSRERLVIRDTKELDWS